MPDGVCMDCGMILPADTKVCTVCGFDNENKELKDIPHFEYSADYLEDIAPENYPGF